jgi:hypothetical protein
MPSLAGRVTASTAQISALPVHTVPRNLGLLKRNDDCRDGLLTSGRRSAWGNGEALGGDFSLADFPVEFSQR